MRIATAAILAWATIAGLSGCAAEPIRTGSPHLDRALAATHDAGYPARGRESSVYGRDVDRLRGTIKGRG